MVEKAVGTGGLGIFGWSEAIGDWGLWGASSARTKAAEFPLVLIKLQFREQSPLKNVFTVPTTRWK